AAAAIEEVAHAAQLLLALEEDALRERLAEEAGAGPSAAVEPEEHLRQPDREPVLLQDLVRERARRGRDVGVGHDLVHEADAMRAGGAAAGGGEAERARFAGADEPRRAVGRAGARHDAERDLGLAEARAGARHAQVARERELATAAEAEAADRRDRRERRLL